MDLDTEATRSDAVWMALAKDFVARRLDSGEARTTDMLSVVVMQSDSKVCSA